MDVVQFHSIIPNATLDSSLHGAVQKHARLHTFVDRDITDTLVALFLSKTNVSLSHPHTNN